MKRLILNDQLHKQLCERVAAELRRLIRLRALSDPLPGEIALSAHLKVSRPVLREALELLSSEGILIKRQGCRTRIVHDLPAHERTTPLRVLALLPRHLSSRTVRDVRDGIEKKGWLWLAVAMPGGHARVRERILNQSWSDNEPDCLLLPGSSKATQQWAMRQKHPTVVVGSTFPEVELPSVDVDYRALGWHAGGRFASAGRLQIVIPTRLPLLAGDEAVIQGLSDFMHQQPGAQVTTLPIHDRDLPIQLDRIHHRFKNGQSALFTLQAEDSLTALTWLLHRGFRVPGDVGLLSRESLPFLEVTCPVLSRYESNPEKLVRSILQMISAVSAGRRMTPVRVMPRFVRGETL